MHLGDVSHTMVIDVSHTMVMFHTPWWCFAHHGDVSPTMVMYGSIQLQPMGGTGAVIHASLSYSEHSIHYW